MNWLSLLPVPKYGVPLFLILLCSSFPLGSRLLALALLSLAETVPVVLILGIEVHLPTPLPISRNLESHFLTRLFWIIEHYYFHFILLLSFVSKLFEPCEQGVLCNKGTLSRSKYSAHLPLGRRLREQPSSEISCFVIYELLCVRALFDCIRSPNFLNSVIVYSCFTICSSVASSRPLSHTS